MNMQPTIKRLQGLKQSLEAARDTEHPIKMPLIDAMNSGLQIAIDAIDSELRIIAAGQVISEVKL
jgi:hypothetical protein